MNFLTEKALSTKERNELPESSFGLPKERKFPLNDEAHVLSAIRYFKYAKPHQRKELAKNIVKAMDKFDMDITINKDNILYNYVDNKKYIAESHYHFNRNTMVYELSKYNNIGLSINDKIKIALKGNEYLNNVIISTTSTLNESFREIINFNEYNGINNNYMMIAVYDDILECIADKNIDAEKSFHVCKILSIIMELKNLDYIDNFIRNAYSICCNSDNVYHKQIMEMISRIVNSRNNKSLRHITRVDMTKIISELNKIDYNKNIKDYLETENEKLVQLYIRYNNHDINPDTGIVDTEQKLECINMVTDEEFNTCVNEGLEIDKDGNIKISVNYSMSYMDQYSEAHKILAENYKNKNYEGMKSNLAFMFQLISKIERDKRYKQKDPDLVKARAFAINDFKTYLGKLQKVEPDFNFIEYYENSDMGKYVLYIPKESITGIKSLFKIIMA